MGKFNNQLNYVIERINHIKTIDPNMSKEEVDSENEPIYKEVLKILEDHIESELKEEKTLGLLIESLKNYRKHLKFAKIIMDKDFSCQPSGNDDIKISCNPPDGTRDLANAKKQIKLAQKEWQSSKEYLKKILEEGKLKLE